MIRSRLPRLLTRFLLTLGPLLLLTAFAGVAAGTDPTVTPAPGGLDTNYLMSLGPYGALVWGAFLLGRGVRLTVAVELTEKDRELLARLGQREGARKDDA